MGRGRSRESGWFFLPAAILVLLLLGAQQLGEAMTPPMRQPIPRPSEAFDRLNLSERMMALKMYRMVREAEAQQEQIDRHRFLEEVVNLSPKTDEPVVKVLATQRH